VVGNTDREGEGAVALPLIFPFLKIKRTELVSQSVSESVVGKTKLSEKYIVFLIYYK